MANPSLHIKRKYRIASRTTSRKFAELSLASRITEAGDRVAEVQEYFRKLDSAPLESALTSESLENLANYILADDLAQGLSLMRSPRTPDAVRKEELDRPSMGEGAVEYAEFTGEHSLDELSRVKDCEVCGHPFIDRTKPRNKKRCGESCDLEHNRQRKRARTDRKNRAQKGEVVDKGDSRYKRERERQQHEYGFYSPWELTEVRDRGESPVAPDSFDHGELARKTGRLMKHELNGKVAGKHEIEDDWPTENRVVKSIDRQHDIKWGPVKKYRLKTNVISLHV